MTTKLTLSASMPLDVWKSRRVELNTGEVPVQWEQEDVEEESDQVSGDENPALVLLQPGHGLQPLFLTQTTCTHTPSVGPGVGGGHR